VVDGRADGATVRQQATTVVEHHNPVAQQAPPLIRMGPHHRRCETIGLESSWTGRLMLAVVAHGGLDRQIG
jgi:hypothetical protein